MANDTARWLGRAIQEHRPEIVGRWLERVQQDILRTPGVSLTQLRDGMPDYLTSLAQLLASDGGAAARRGAWQTVAREHGITRVRIGFDISQLVHEFIVLRQVIRGVVAEQAKAPPDVEAVLADLLDAAISLSVQAYVDARDYEARRRQAENIGFITHELRNPLSTAMLIVAQLQSKIVEQEAEARVHPRVVERLERSLRAIEQLIASVLLTEKLEAGKQEARAVPIRLADVVEGAVEAARRVAAQKGLAFNLSYEPNRTVRVDPILTRSAIQNLADNAAKYTDAGQVDVVLAADAGDLVVDVRDTCQGLSPEELRTIFEPFQRGRTRQAGTGLGLALARRAAEAQGGTIEAESSGSSGCHFRIRLPGAAG